MAGRTDPIARALKTTLQGIVQSTFEGLWSAGFAAAGRLARPRPRLWSSPGCERVLVVAPHPDDEVAGCAGAILAHRAAGDRVRVSIATDGRRSRALGCPGARMAAVRRGEAEAAAAHLDVELDWTGLPEGEWRLEELENRLAGLLAEFRPAALYAPSRVDFHPEHERVARALGRALGSGPDPDLEIRIYGVQVPLTPRLANLALPVDPEAPPLAAAFRAYRSQLGSIERCLRRRRYAGRLYRLGAADEGRARRTGPVETFWRLTPARYRRLHREAPARPLHRSFRGLRYYAWSDPLAYLVGLGERRRLARTVP